MGFGLVFEVDGEKTKRIAVQRSGETLLEFPAGWSRPFFFSLSRNPFRLWMFNCPQRQKVQMATRHERKFLSRDETKHPSKSQGRGCWLPDSRTESTSGARRKKLGSGYFSHEEKGVLEVDVNRDVTWYCCRLLTTLMPHHFLL